MIKLLCLNQNESNCYRILYCTADSSNINRAVFSKRVHGAHSQSLRPYGAPKLHLIRLHRTEKKSSFSIILLIFCVFLNYMFVDESGITPVNLEVVIPLS